MGRTDEALERLDRAKELDDKSPALWNEMGVILAEIGRDDEALDCFVRSMELDLYYPPSWNNKGVMLARKGAYDDAVTCFRNALHLNGGFSEAWYNGGLALAAVGVTENSEKSFEMARSLGLELDSQEYILVSQPSLMEESSKPIVEAARDAPGFGCFFALLGLILIAKRRR